MKTIFILLATAALLRAAEPPPSFVWQGKTIVVEQLEMMDDTRARLPDGTVVPISAVPPLLRANIAPAPPPGSLLKQHRVLQILPDGLLLTAQAVVRSDWSKLEKRWIRTEQDFEPVFLRGCRVNTEPDATLTCYAEPDGKYTYTTLRGAVKTVDAWKFTGWPQPRPAPKALLPGSQIKGSALDARDWRTQRR